jgi:hypothetical protein
LIGILFVLNFVAGPKVFGWLTYLFMKQGSLFCFVLAQWDLPNLSRLLHAHALGIFRKLLMMSRGAPKFWFEDCLELQCGSYWLLNDFSLRHLIVEWFSQWKLNKIKTNICIGIWECSWCCWKALSKSDLIELISQFSELRCGRYWFLSGFCFWKFKKIGFRRKNQSSPQFIHIDEFRNFLILEK